MNFSIPKPAETSGSPPSDWRRPTPVSYTHLELTPDGAQEYLGNYDDYLEKKRTSENEESSSSPVLPGKGSNDYRLQKERQAEERKRKNRLKKAEEAISQTENEISRLETLFEDPEIAANYERSWEISKELEEQKSRLEILYDEWLMLTENAGAN